MFRIFPLKTKKNKTYNLANVQGSDNPKISMSAEVDCQQLAGDTCDVTGMAEYMVTVTRDGILVSGQVSGEFDSKVKLRFKLLLI